MTIEIFHQTMSKNKFDYSKYIRKYKNFDFICLIDNHHFQYDKEIIPPNIYKNLDIIVFESSLKEIAEDLISNLEIKESNNKIFFKGIVLKKNGSLTCPILTAAFYMCRLGFYPYPKDTLFMSKTKKTRANKIVNVLSKKFESNEKLVMKILENFNISSKEIEYEFYEDV